MNIKQLAVGGFDNNFSYLISDSESGQAAVIDPCGNVQVIRDALAELENPVPAYILLTHCHHDHTEGVEAVRRFFPAPVTGHPAGHYPGLQPLSDRQRLALGGGFIEVLYAPGHTPDSVIYRLSDDSALFTGDTLFIDWCGYCEPAAMFRTMRQVIMPLADSNTVYSGHDYGRRPAALLGEEKLSNPYLNTDDFAVFLRRLENL
jgi:glyoxylase-like metal-dependent hydrolase (beta-lactamase superfamily II)